MVVVVVVCGGVIPPLDLKAQFPCSTPSRSREFLGFSLVLLISSALCYLIFCVIWEFCLSILFLPSKMVFYRALFVLLFSTLVGWVNLIHRIQFYSLPPPPRTPRPSPWPWDGLKVLCVSLKHLLASISGTRLGVLYFFIYTLTGIILDLFSLGNHKWNRSKLIPVTI